MERVYIIMKAERGYNKMPVKMTFGGFTVHAGNDSLEMSVYAVGVLLDVLDRLSELAMPKYFVYSGSTLKRMEQVPSNGKMHQVKVTSPVLPFIDEIVEWQVYGSIGGRIVNCRVESVFHTHEGNRTGSKHWTINGKDPYLRQDLGGLCLDDVWQDNNKWKEA